MKLNLLGMSFIGLFDSFVSPSSNKILLTALDTTEPFIKGKKSSVDILGHYKARHFYPVTDGDSPNGEAGCTGVKPLQLL